MPSNDELKKALTSVLFTLCTFMSSGGISINLSNSSMTYIENQSNNYYYLKDDNKT